MLALKTFGLRRSAIILKGRKRSGLGFEAERFLRMSVALRKLPAKD
jgi:hypothetical protein